MYIPTRSSFFEQFCPQEVVGWLGQSQGTQYSWSAQNIANISLKKLNVCFYNACLSDR